MVKKLLFIVLMGCIPFLFGFQATKQHTLSKTETIQAVMNYPMDFVVDRCQKEFGYSDQDMIILEKELKRFLILCITKPDPKQSVSMFSRDVDNLWHMFILFTREYTDFGTKFAGRYLHHAPNIKKANDENHKKGQKLRQFIIDYEDTFNEPIHNIWLMDSFIKNSENLI